MSNIWVNSEEVLQIAELALADEAVVPFASNRSYEDKFVGGVGDTVSVSVPRAGTAKKFTGTTTAGAISSTKVPIKIEEHFYERYDVTSKEDLVDLRSFTQNILLPGIQAVVTGFEQYAVRKAAAGFSPSVTGSVGTEITTKAQYYAAEKAIFDAKGNTSNLVGLLTSASYSNLAQLNENTSIDFNPNGPANLAGNMIGQIANIKRTFRSRHAGTVTKTAFTGTPVTNGAGAAGERVLMTIDGLTDAAGTVFYAGQRATIADSTGSFILLEDMVIGASGEITGYFYAPDAWVDGKAVTAGTDIKRNIIYNPASLACVILPGMPGSNSMIIRARDALGNDCGFAIRMVETEISGSTLAKSFVFDCFAGVSAVERLHGLICN